MYEVNLTPENHGDTIRLVKQQLVRNEDKKIVETTETIATLMIENDHRTAVKAFDSLNTFISVCVEAKIIPEDVFNFRQSR